MVASNPDGVDMVENSNGKYAFFMESSSIEYLVERRCKLAQVRLQSPCPRSGLGIIESIVIE
jgi:hypothetical protein